MAPIRVGILGASKIAPLALILPVRDNAAFEIAAVAARDCARAQVYAKEHAIPCVEKDYAALVARKDLDLIYNPLPPSAHGRWSIAALEAGKAVLCEKPFALNAGEARAMVAAAARAKRPLIEAFHYRYHNVMMRAVEIARSGELGRLAGAEAVFEVPIAYRPGELRWTAPVGGGAMMDLGCYALHALRSLAGEEPEIAAAQCDVEHGVDVSTRADLRFPSGLRASLRCSMAPKTIAASLKLTGENGELAIVNFLAPQMGYSFRVTVNGHARDEKPDGPSTYAAQLAHVADVLLRGATPLTGGEDAIANMAAIDAIYAKAGFVRASA